MMQITVKLFANLRKYAPGDKNVFTMTVDPETTINSLLQQLKVPAGVDRVILVNGRRGKEEGTLADGDTLTLFPPMTGG